MTTAPDLEAIEEWIEALEEGAYEQTIGDLCDESGGGHCCLGVAASLSGKSDEDLYGRSLLSLPFPELHDRIGLSLPGHFGDDANLADGEYAEDVLMTLNDIRALTFDQIAHVLREELLKPLQKAYREAGCIQ